MTTRHAKSRWILKLLKKVLKNCRPQKALMIRRWWMRVYREEYRHMEGFVSVSVNSGFIFSFHAETGSTSFAFFENLSLLD